MRERPLLLWDGECTLCARFAALARSIDPGQGVRIVPSQQLSDQELAQLGLTRAQCERAAIFVDERGRVRQGAFAINAFARRISWAAPLAIVLEATPLVLAAELAVYAFTAKNRARISRALRR